MARPSSLSSRRRLLLCGALLGPLLITAPYWALSRYPQVVATRLTDILAMLVGALVASSCTFFLPHRPARRIMAALLIAPAAFFVVGAFGFILVDAIVGVSPYSSGR